jgi:hypothetical protein
MIIPPDPEKDPNFFNPSASTSSLVPQHLEQSPDGLGHGYGHGDEYYEGDDDVRYPDAARTRQNVFGNGSFGSDGWSGEHEQLPPYERRRIPSIRNGNGRDGPGIEVDRNANANLDPASPFVTPLESSDRSSSETPRVRSYPILATSTRHPAGQGIYRQANTTPYGATRISTTFRASSSSLPSLNAASPSTTIQIDPNTSSSKLWESSSPASSSSTGGKKRKRGNGKGIAIAGLGIVNLNLSPEIKHFWSKWKKWVIGIGVVALVGIGLIMGLLVGLKADLAGKAPPSEKTYSPWHDVDGKKANAEWPVSICVFLGAGESVSKSMFMLIRLA